MSESTEGPAHVELPHLLRDPVIPESCYVDPSARINGDVTMGEEGSVWFHACIRGDVNSIRIGARTNVQDGCILHTLYRKFDLVVGDDVTYGHAAIMHGCHIGNRVLIGMKAMVLDGAVISDDTIIAAGSIVTEGKTFPPGVLLMGAPARVKRELTEKDLAFIRERSAYYVEYAKTYRRSGLFHTFADNRYYRSPNA